MGGLLRYEVWLKAIRGWLADWSPDRETSFQRRPQAVPSRRRQPRHPKDGVTMACGPNHARFARNIPPLVTPLLHTPLIHLQIGHRRPLNRSVSASESKDELPYRVYPPFALKSSYELHILKNSL